MSHAVSSMAISKAPSCEIRALVMHVYPDGIKAFGHERLDVPLGRRGKPVKKVRFMPMAKLRAKTRQMTIKPRRRPSRSFRPVKVIATPTKGSAKTLWESLISRMKKPIESRTLNPLCPIGRSCKFCTSINQSHGGEHHPNPDLRSPDILQPILSL